LGDVLGYDQAGAVPLQLNSPGKHADIDDGPVLSALAPDLVPESTRGGRGEPAREASHANIGDRHTEKFLAQVAVLLDGSPIHFEEAAGGRVMEAGRLRVVLEERAEFCSLRRCARAARCCWCWVRAIRATGRGQRDAHDNGGEQRPLLGMSLLLPCRSRRRQPHCQERSLLAAVVVGVTLASAGARIALTQHQQQRAARATVEAEQKFRALFEDNPQPTCLHDPAPAASSK